jgi:biotin-(acetyl-CoA carboxylase) ligase
LAYKNQQIILSAINQEPEVCTLIGLDPQGNLLVEGQNGVRKSFLAGEISLRPVQKYCGKI